MFYEGNLQSGIAEAIQQQKLVVCFFKGDNNDSAEWESSYLREEDVCVCIEEPAGPILMFPDSTDPREPSNHV